MHERGGFRAFYGLLLDWMLIVCYTAEYYGDCYSLKNNTEGL